VALRIILLLISLPPKSLPTSGGKIGEWDFTAPGQWTVVLKIDKEITEIMQCVGVRQGDNMAPVLFLFLMSAVAETLEPAW
jgi:hypothetical protein